MSLCCLYCKQECELHSLYDNKTGFLCPICDILYHDNGEYSMYQWLNSYQAFVIHALSNSPNSAKIFSGLNEMYIFRVIDKANHEKCIYNIVSKYTGDEPTYNIVDLVWLPAEFVQKLTPNNIKDKIKTYLTFS